MDFDFKDTFTRLNDLHEGHGHTNERAGKMDFGNGKVITFDGEPDVFADNGVYIEPGAGTNDDSVEYRIDCSAFSEKDFYVCVHLMTTVNAGYTQGDRTYVPYGETNVLYDDGKELYVDVDVDDTRPDGSICFLDENEEENSEAPIDCGLTKEELQAFMKEWSSEFISNAVEDIEEAARDAAEEDPEAFMSDDEPDYD